MQLPYFQSDIQQLNLMQTKWQGILNPLIAKEITNGNLLTGITLVTGVNTINHLLGRQMVGWFLTDINAAVTVYRSQPFNDKTLSLTSSGAAQVNLWVF